jgi:hypothetical protein
MRDSHQKAAELHDLAAGPSVPPLSATAKRIMSQHMNSPDESSSIQARHTNFHSVCTRPRAAA